MSSTFDAYVGFADETEYGTAVAPTNFVEFTKEDIAGDYQRIESAGIRAGTRVVRADRFIPNPKGAAGSVEFEVQNQGLSFFLKHMFGDVSTSGAADPYTWTAKLAQLLGKSFTTQVNRPDANGNDNIFTYEGGKVTDWEIANSVDGLVTANLSMDFCREVIGAGAGAYAAAMPTFPANVVLLSFLGGTVTVGAAQFSVTDISVKGTNGLKTDRYFIRGDGSKKEPRENDFRAVTFDLKGEFESDEVIKMVADATAAGTLATIDIKWATPDGSHSLELNLPAARLDSAPVNVDGVAMLTQDLQGTALAPVTGDASPIVVTYTTPDAPAA